MDSNNKIETCLSRKSSEGKPQIFTTLRNIDLNLLTIFEAVYVHKGIVNAAKVLNLTPSAISQSIQKLRVIFPDPLFIRKGQGVTPTAFAMHLHEYISQGLESILGALDIEGSYDKQRTITIATTPSVGALVLPVIYRAIKTHYPQLLLRNPPISDAENQLSQFQTDLIIDNMFCTNRTVQHHVLFTDNMVLICREGNPLLSLEDDRETIDNAAHILLLPEGQNFSGLRQRVQEMFPDRQISFTSYNILTIAALVANSDMLAIIPSRFYNLFSRCWPLEKLPFPSLNEEQIDFSIHYNKFSLRDPILHGVIDVIRNAF
ncbi:LysR family transcriptional regulator [Escherichia coli]|nr:LysR family transcriptional regulator [Escherichia coli]